VPTPYNGSLYVTCRDWNIYCFEEAPPAQPWTPPPEPTYPTAEEIAQKVLDELPINPSADDIANAIADQFPDIPTAEEIAQKTISQLPAYPEVPDVPSAEEVAQETINRLPAYPEIPAYLTIDLVIIAAVAVAIIIGIVSYLALRKQK